MVLGSSGTGRRQYRLASIILQGQILLGKRKGVVESEENMERYRGDSEKSEKL